MVMQGVWKLIKYIYLLIYFIKYLIWECCDSSCEEYYRLEHDVV
jgi:hypothetical protein